MSLLDDVSKFIALQEVEADDQMFVKKLFKELEKCGAEFAMIYPEQTADMFEKMRQFLNSSDCVELQIRAAMLKLLELSRDPSDADEEDDEGEASWKLDEKSISYYQQFDYELPCEVPEVAREVEEASALPLPHPPVPNFDGIENADDNQMVVDTGMGAINSGVENKNCQASDWNARVGFAYNSDLMIDGHLLRICSDSEEVVKTAAEIVQTEMLKRPPPLPLPLLVKVQAVDRGGNTFFARGRGRRMMMRDRRLLRQPLLPGDGTDAAPQNEAAVSRRRAFANTYKNYLSESEMFGDGPKAAEVEINGKQEPAGGTLDGPNDAVTATAEPTRIIYDRQFMLFCARLPLSSADIDDETRSALKRLKIARGDRSRK